MRRILNHEGTKEKKKHEEMFNLSLLNYFNRIMETTAKNKTKQSKSESKAAQAYANDAYFVKKREASLKMLQKAGIPSSFSSGKK